MKYKGIANTSIFYLVGFNINSILWFSSQLSVYIKSHHTAICRPHSKYTLLSLV